MPEALPSILESFDERAWPDARPDGALGTDRQWAWLRWNRARAAWRKSHPRTKNPRA